MKGKIDRGGLLWMERGGIEKYMVCPFCNDKDGDCQAPCGDWCALFREPVSHAFADDGKTRITIELCRASHTFLAEDLVDERKEEFTDDTCQTSATLTQAAAIVEQLAFHYRQTDFGDVCRDTKIGLCAIVDHMERIGKDTHGQTYKRVDAEDSAND